MYRFKIAYNRLTRTVEIFPESSAPSAQTMYIGEFEIDNPKAPFESYREDLSKAVEDAMAYVGQPDLTDWEVKVKTWDHDQFVVAKERDASSNVFADIPGTVVPVTEDVTIAQVAEREQSDDPEDQVETSVEKDKKTAARQKADAKKDSDKKD